MFAPHSVTVYNVCGNDEVYVTFLEGVFLDTGQNREMIKNGVAVGDRAVLYIPFACRAVNALDGQIQMFCSPKDYDAYSSRDGVWTIGPRDQRSGADCFFVRGKVISPEMDFAELNDRYSGVFRVSSVDVRDFGSLEMRHWQIGGK